MFDPAIIEVTPVLDIVTFPVAPLTPIPVPAILDSTPSFDISSINPFALVEIPVPPCISTVAPAVIFAFVPASPVNNQPEYAAGTVGIVIVLVFKAVTWPVEFLVTESTAVNVPAEPGEDVLTVSDWDCNAWVMVNVSVAEAAVDIIPFAPPSKEAVFPFVIVWLVPESPAKVQFIALNNVPTNTL